MSGALRFSCALFLSLVSQLYMILWLESVFNSSHSGLPSQRLATMPNRWHGKVSNLQNSFPSYCSVDMSRVARDIFSFPQFPPRQEVSRWPPQAQFDSSSDRAYFVARNQSYVPSYLIRPRTLVSRLLENY